MKRGVESRKFPFCIFLQFFFLTLFLNNYLILYLLKTKIIIKIGHFWQKIWFLKVFNLWPFQAKMLAGGIFHNFFVFAHTGMLKPSHFFCTKVFCPAFHYLEFGFVIFWRKTIGAKATRKMLLKLTIGSFVNLALDVWVYCNYHEKLNLYKLQIIIQKDKSCVSPKLRFKSILLF